MGLTLASRLDTMAWEPSISLDRYPNLPEYKKLYPFRHTFPSRDTDRFKIFKTSAISNREVATTAAEYISTLSLGKRGVTDMLSIGVNVSPYLYGREADNRIETMDALLRLDRDIASIVKAVENGPGMANTLLFVAGTPAPRVANATRNVGAYRRANFRPARPCRCSTCISWHCTATVSG